MVNSSIRGAAKDLARRLVPHALRPRLRVWHNRLTWPLYAGGNVVCNCCDGRFRRFRAWSDEQGKLWPMCPRCGSLGRQRVDWLFLTTRTDLLSSRKRVLHVAPETCFAQTLQRRANIDYLSADYDSALAMERMNITDIGYPDGSFDVVLCNHVLVYVDDDMRAMREIHRVLRSGGWALLQVPVDDSRKRTFEDASVTDPRERHRIFGQYDHVRVYGRDYVSRLRQAGFDVSVDDFVTALPASTIARHGLDSNEIVYLARKA
jgi:SAM-dependent methyltransferase